MRRNYEMIEKYKCNNCGMIINVPTFNIEDYKPHIEGDVFFNIEKEEERKRLSQYYYECINKHKPLILKDTYTEITYYRTLIFDEEQQGYVDEQRKDFIYDIRLLYRILDREQNNLRFVFILEES
jgi:hypothetical protein